MGKLRVGKKLSIEYDEYVSGVGLLVGGFRVKYRLYFC